MSKGNCPLTGIGIYTTHRGELIYYHEKELNLRRENSIPTLGNFLYCATLNIKELKEYSEEIRLILAAEVVKIIQAKKPIILITKKIIITKKNSKNILVLILKLSI